MDLSDSPPWLPEDRKISNEEWARFRRKYASELGFDTVPARRRILDSSQLWEIERSFSEDSNWHLLMPPDAVTRMEAAERPYEVLKKIIDETAENVFQGTDPTPTDLYLIADNIITRYKGSTDLQIQDVRSGNFESQGGHGNAVYDEMTIVIVSTNSRNFEDWYVYVVEDATELFGQTLSSMTQAAYAIYEAGLEPDEVLEDVAVTLQDGGMGSASVSGVTPPDHPVTIVETDASSRGYYYRIDIPHETFGSKWGDIESINKCLTDQGIVGQKIGEGPVGFWIVTGVNW